MNWILTEGGDLINLDRMEVVEVMAEEDADVSWSHVVFARRDAESGYVLATGNLEQCQAVIKNLGASMGMMIVSDGEVEIRG